MTKIKLEPFRQQLLELGRRLQGDVGSLADEVFRKTGKETNSNLSGAPVGDRAELGSDDYDDDVTIELLEMDGARLEEINAAMERIKNGSFGRCEECGREISCERLQAIPFARRCIECARSPQRGNATSAGNL